MQIDNIGSTNLPASVVSKINALPQIPTKDEYESNKEVYLLKMVVAIVDSKEKHVTDELIRRAAKATGIYDYADSKMRKRAVNNFFQYGMIDRRRTKLLDPVKHVTNLTGKVINAPYYKVRKLTISEAREIMREWLFTGIHLRPFIEKHNLCYSQLYTMIRTLSVSGRIYGYRTIKSGKDAGKEIYSYKTIFNYIKYAKVDIKTLAHLTKYGTYRKSVYLEKHPGLSTAELLQYQRSISVLQKYL